MTTIPSPKVRGRALLNVTADLRTEQIDLFPPPPLLILRECFLNYFSVSGFLRAVRQIAGGNRGQIYQGERIHIESLLS